MLDVTPKQAQVRDHAGLSLLIIAPAGCGKTETLALRVKGLLSRQAIKASQRILVATFTKRARDNMHDTPTKSQPCRAVVCCPHPDPHPQGEGTHWLQK